MEISPEDRKDVGCLAWPRRYVGLKLMLAHSRFIYIPKVMALIIMHEDCATNHFTFINTIIVL